MNFTKYKIFNKTEFDALDLVSKTYTLNLLGVGQKDILVTQGELLSILFDGIFLPLSLNDKNPFVKLGESEDELAYAILMDELNDVYLCIEVPE